MKQRYKIRNFNFILVVLALTLSIIGIMIIGSAKASVQNRQIMGLVMGIAVMMFFTFIDYSFILKLYWPIYIINAALLLLVLFVGDSSNNAQRWVEIGGIRFQPSELAKILLILFYSQFIMVNKARINTFRTIIIMLALCVPPLMLVYAQPDLSTTIMIFAIFCVLYFIGGLSWKIIAGILAVVVPVTVILLILVIQPDQNIIKDYQQNRILAWLQPDKYSNTEGYQQQNSIVAIGSGQLTGKGYKNNEVGSVKNGNFISEPQTDFIFAIVGEELGFSGCIVIILLELLISFELLKMGRRAKDLSGTLICAGVAANISIQSFLNISVATGVMPNTGLPLPFVSYGLTSLVSLYIGLGVCLNVGLQPHSDREYASFDDIDFDF